MGSRPVVVELTGLRVLLAPKPSSEWSNEEELRRVQLARQRLVDRADLLFGLDDRKEGYLERLVTRVSDNLELQLRDLHIRFQERSLHTVSYIVLYIYIINDLLSSDCVAYDSSFTYCLFLPRAGRRLVALDSLDDLGSSHEWHGARPSLTLHLFGISTSPS